MFNVSPVLMAVALRTVGGDGWADAGLRAGSLRWYPFALLVFPITLAVILGLGVVSRSIVIGGSPGDLLIAIVIGGVPSLLFALFEDWGWRGYLEPRLQRLGVPALRRHLLAGGLWGIWNPRGWHRCWEWDGNRWRARASNTRLQARSTATLPTRCAPTGRRVSLWCYSAGPDGMPARFRGQRPWQCGSGRDACRIGSATKAVGALAVTHLADAGYREPRHLGHNARPHSGG